MYSPSKSDAKASYRSTMPPHPREMQHGGADNALKAQQSPLLTAAVAVTINNVKNI